MKYPGKVIWQTGRIVRRDGVPMWPERRMQELKDADEYREKELRTMTAKSK